MNSKPITIIFVGVLLCSIGLNIIQGVHYINRIKNENRVILIINTDPSGIVHPDRIVNPRKKHLPLFIQNSVNN